MKMNSQINENDGKNRSASKRTFIPLYHYVNNALFVLQTQQCGTCTKQINFYV